MRKCCSRLILAAAVGLGLTGCGSDNKTVEPKLGGDGPKVEPKTPGGPPGPGGKPSGPVGGVE